MAAWTALILTGGSSTRMGRDKARATVGGRPMLDRLLAGLPSTVPVVVAGPEPATAVRPVTVRREEPPGGGPVAGIAAGLPAVPTEIVAICAVDMPLAAGLLATLVDELAADPSADAVVPVTGAGHRQPLCAVYRTAPLRTAVDSLGLPAGRSVRALVAALHVAEYVLADDDVRALDADTPEQLAALRAAARAGGILAAGDGEREVVMQEWVDALRRELGLEADGAAVIDVDLVLDVAKDAAHGVERPAAPLTTYLVGYAVAKGADPTAAAAVVARMAESWSARG